LPFEQHLPRWLTVSAEASRGAGVGPLRIAHLTTVDMSLALLLATELTVDLEHGHTVFGISSPGPYVERVEALGVTHVPIGELTRSWSPVSDLRAFRELSSTIRSLDLDVLHTHNPKTGVMGRIAGRLARVPVVVNTCHGLWARPEDSLAKRAFVYGLEALAARFSDYELFQNAADMATMRRFLTRGRHRVVGNGVDLARFVPDQQGRDRVRAELGIADDVLLVGGIGRRVREKGVAEFADAASRLADRAMFVWVGPEDQTDAAGPVPHEDAVRFVGERTDMPAVYSALDVFVLPSYREGFSRAAMEAAACGTAMVLSDIRGCREIGDHERQVLLVPPADAPSLARAVDRLLVDPDLRNRLGAAARQRALTSFDQRAVAQVSLDTYAAVGRRRTDADGADRRMTVVHVLPSDLDRGAQVYAGRLRDALAGDPEQRHLVVSLFAAPDGVLRADLRLGVPPGRARRAGLDPRAVARLRKALRDVGADVVVAHGGEPLKYAVAAAGRTPLVYYKIGLSSAEMSRAGHRRLYRLLTRRATRVVAVSRAVADQCHRVLGVPRDRLSVIPNGRDPETYRPAAASSGGATLPPSVLFVGRLEPGKRPGLFLDVVECLRQRGHELDARMVGDGPLRSDLERRADTLGVQLLGVRTDVPDLMRETAVLVMTSAADTEGMPGVLVEAGLSGVPVVSTAAAGVDDVVTDGVTGFVVDSGRPAEIADRVDTLVTHPDVRATMGARAREQCTRSFTISASAEQWRILTPTIVRRAASEVAQA
jgi:glycosyltransferase involved in cell wall biosynthesis